MTPFPPPGRWVRVETKHLAVTGLVYGTPKNGRIDIGGQLLRVTAIRRWRPVAALVLPDHMLESA